MNSVKLAIPKERLEHEKRVAATPETVKKLGDLGLRVVVETGAGQASAIADSAFEEAGATIAPDAAETFRDADIVFKVQRPLPEEISLMKRGAILVAILSPYKGLEGVKACAEAGINAFAMEFMPRITRAQPMDVLSSQSNLAGYRAVIDAAAVFKCAMPMMITAAGTIAPARVMVMGAGVAGLQAIATARRLGAIVCATDVRPAAQEEVESLGASFVMVESKETKDAETAGGYAGEMSEDYKKRQEKLVAETINSQDIVICTALIPGRPAPLLITEEMVKSMKAGSIIVDLAVEQGGNCALSKPGEVVEVYGVTILGHLNVPGRLSRDASALYAKNLLNFITPLIETETNTLKIDWEDEIIKGTALTRDGALIHPVLVKWCGL